MNIKNASQRLKLARTGKSELSLKLKCPVVQLFVVTLIG